MDALHRKVLVVDDDPVVGMSFSRVLSRKGYVVVTAVNALEALSKVQDGDYDVVFTDIRMPGMSGIELAERLKRERPWTPVVIVTGFGSVQNEERAKAVGVSSFLQKPVSLEMIEVSMLKALLEAVPRVVPGLVEAVKPEAVRQETAAVEAVRQNSRVKMILLFMAAPFIGLLYALLLPFVAFGAVAFLIFQALRNNENARKAMALAAAPFIGLAFVVALPFVGASILAWNAGRSLIKKLQGR